MYAIITYSESAIELGVKYPLVIKYFSDEGEFIKEEILTVAAMRELEDELIPYEFLLEEEEIEIVRPFGAIFVEIPKK